MKKTVFVFAVFLPVYAVAAGKCLKEIMAHCPKISERSACLEEKKMQFSAQCTTLVQGMIDFKSEPATEKTAKPEPDVAKEKPVKASNQEEALFDSCMKPAKNKSEAEPVCRCHAKKWASGSIPVPNKPSETKTIDKKFVDQMIADWDAANKAARNSNTLKGDDGMIVAIAMNIGINCAKEAGLFK